MKSSAVFAICLLAASASHAAANLVVNGSFEQGPAGIGSFQGWQTTLGDPATFVDSNGQTGNHYGQASDGLWSAYLGSTSASGGATLSQTLATVTGQTYALSFDLANDNAGAAAANALNVTLGSNTAISLSSLPTQNYTTFGATFVATGVATVLSFSAFNDASYLELDRISVSAVPEPATIALLLAGLAMVGLKSSHGRRTSTVGQDLAGAHGQEALMPA